jgi:hypothetical protein
MSCLRDRRRFLQTSLAAGGIATWSGASFALGTTPQGTPAPSDESSQRRVRPGRVRWHEDFAEACTASRRSGKPALLFHMMGRLDEKLC